ncbi:MAG: caspase family protein, partial [Deltaproteobacteria bacterium]|nr:caspase family protein [Deltaproteobacteria bacterium]
MDSGSSQPPRAFGVVGAGGKVALVIGNGAYKDNPLNNPPNDARDMGQTLGSLGFDVILKENADKRTMLDAIDRFGEKLRSAEVGLFFFAGHGMQVKGRNYLIPTEARISVEQDVELESVDAVRVLGRMESAGNKVNIVILDACRNNPFARSFRAATTGLARMDAPTGSIISFATAPDSVAQDGSGRNGTYTKHLLTNIKIPGLKIEDVLKRVRNDVLNETGKKQVPWDSSSLTGDFYFVPLAAAANPAPSPITNSPVVTSPPAIQTAGGLDVEELARQRKKEQEDWAAWQKRMDAEFSKLEKHDRENLLNAKDKEEMWEAFQTTFAGDNKYSQNDKLLREKAGRRQAYWQQKHKEEEDKARLEADRQKPKLFSTTSPDTTADGIIVRNGLEWYEGPNKDMTWDEARSWAAGLTVGGGGWRMPTRSELKGLYVKGINWQNIDPAFHMTDRFVWSGETKDSSSAWIYDFRSNSGGDYWIL